MKKNKSGGAITNLKRILDMLAQAWKLNKGYCLITAINNTFNALLTYINIIGLGSVVNALVTNESLDRILRIIIIYLLINLVIAISKEILNLIEQFQMRFFTNIAQFSWNEDIVNIDYHYVQDGTIRDLRMKSMLGHPAFYIYNFGVFIGYIVQFAGIISVFSLLSPLFIIVIAIMSLVSIILIFKTRKNDFALQNDKIEEDRKIDYLYKVMTEYYYAKEVRMNNAESYISNKYSKIVEIQIKKLKALCKRSIKINLLSTINTIFQTAVMYFYFSYQVFSNQISIGEYTVLLSTTTLLTTLLLGLFDNIAILARRCKQVEFHNDYQSLIKSHSSIIASNTLLNQRADFSNPVIKFENVSFIYPNTNKIILENINLEIRKGERIGIVGLNGSGKTTFIKLLTRIYDPTGGRIILNGVDIRYIPYQEYIKCIGVVLQDFLIFAYSVKENIILDTKYDESKFISSIEKSGLKSRIDSLEKGINTSLYKTLDAYGVELSGGEGQKLALARTIYKDSEILILDEPTSSLDPLAEYDLFSKLNNISENKTTIFISHRLSSTRFCDKIIILFDGKIIECGSHKELINRNGFYANLFNLQAYYYKDIGVNINE